MPEIRPITDLINTNEISELCHARNSPVFIAKNGYVDLVIMSIETYQEILNRTHVDHAILEAEQEYAKDHELLDARKTLPALRRKIFGKV